MAKLTEKKRKWIVQQFRMGRGATSIALIQKISRRMVYKLIAKHKQYGEEAYTTKAVGRPKQPINPTFVEKVVKIRTEDDYGCEKIHFILKNE